MADILEFDPQRGKRSRPEPASPAPTPEPLWRNVLGERLRERRFDEGQTLTETAKRAGISPQYLSEMERGRKEPSSEMIAAVAGALGTTLTDLTSEVARDLQRRRSVAAHPSRGTFSLAA